MVEFDSPAKLLQIPGGAFASMVDDTGRDNAKFLRDVASGALDLRESIERNASEAEGSHSLQRTIRMHGLRGLTSTTYDAPELEQTRKALLKVKAGLYDTPSASWGAALASQEVSESQWLQDLRGILQDLLLVADTRIGEVELRSGSGGGGGDADESSTNDVQDALLLQ
jgi:hypothetical protein